MAYNPQQIFPYASAGGAPAFNSPRLTANTRDPQIQPTTAAVGGNVAPINMPQPALDLQNQIKNLPVLNTQAGSVINNELMGVLSPDTKRAIQDASAGMAVSSGMPGTNVIPGTLGGNLTLRDIGMTSQQLQNQGLKDYSQFVPTVSSTQTTPPALQYETNLQNAVSAAAPNPVAAQSYAEQLFNKYIAQLNTHSAQTAAGKMGLADNGEYFTPAGTNVYLPRT